ncbi:hypothetical protein [Methylobacterium sp. J-068]|uniref:hypothetical protein n=1 Tax=Methylobacterium sp. J-068 TaxID=2836649 RepID=UPI001FBBF8E3|nr:hypothetical protein [Methylobacterium sp. J-068]MCJ2034188.1 hypothetical protein [Methylobacterium sp. J-068]
MTSTTIRNAILALATAATLGTGLGAFAAHAQYYDDDRPRRFERRYDEDRYERRRYDEDRYDRRPRGERFGRLCLTERGNCITEPQPWGSQCRCMIPGFGPKRGEIRG